MARANGKLRVAATLVVSALAATALLSITACSSSGSGNTKPPAGVPNDATFVAKDLSLGVPGGAAETAADQRLFFHIGCTDGILVIVTTRETVYAELPCDRAVPRSIAERFLGKSVRIRVVTKSSKLFVESTTAGSIEFTIGRAWIQAR